ncbi:MAG: SDR family oxidoreductase [Saprospiraceae bacterium]|nr:SDR family oxidoreductase [Saprospiraceae bacterium]
MNWTNKVAVITGASTGIGKATRQLLESKGCIVYNLDLPGADAGANFVPCDVRDRQAIKTALDTVFQRENRLDFVFANAGIHLFASMEETSDEEFDNVTATNIVGAFYTVKYALPYLKAQQKGSIVLMGSDQSFVGKAQSSVYGLTKGAIGQLTKSTAIDYAPHNIRVNCICPGTIDTPLLHKAVQRFSSLNAANETEVLQSLNSIQPLGRIGQPEEIAQVVAFLLSDESSFMTGSLVAADGGYVCQ